MLQETLTRTIKLGPKNANKTIKDLFGHDTGLLIFVKSDTSLSKNTSLPTEVGFLTRDEINQETYKNHKEILKNGRFLDVSNM